MLQINGRSLLVDEMTVLEVLRSHLAERGIALLEKIKPGINNIQFTCPAHAGGRERRPSCGISTSGNGKVSAGMVHCFTCGYTASIEEMVSLCFGFQDNGYTGREWLIKNFLSTSIESRRDLDLDLRRSPAKIKPSFISEEELDRYRYYHPYMEKRKLTDEIIELFDVGFDDAFRVEGGPIISSLTFPVRDIEGNTLFIARRAVSKKFFHYPAGVNKPVYGLFELPKGTKEIIICESIINALTCWVYGKPAVALLGLGTSYQYDQLRSIPARKFIIGLDGDKAGRDAADRLEKALGRYKIITRFSIPDGKDINDLTKQEFENLSEIF